MSGPPDALRLVLLGDSLASGTGADRPDDALGPRLGAALAERGVPTDPLVVAVPGATSADLPSQTGRALALQPDLAVVIVGANDLLRFLPPRPAAALLGEAVRALGAAGAHVLVVPAPDLSVVPQVPPTWRDQVRAACAEMERLQARATTDAGGVALRLGSELAPRFAADRRLLSADRFHPSSAGYALIAEHLAPHLARLATMEPPGERGAA